SPQPVIDEHACELIADGAVHQQCCHREIDPAGETADDASVPHLLANACDLVFGDRSRRPTALTATYLGQEAREDLLAIRRMDYLRVELDAEDAAGRILDRRDRRTRGRRQRGE